ncbi:hypothetical protein [Variovorax paradoxus]|uniref:hypothetical protein n=1 Tax=Variovorax paradoxus TaxID=34073 RepID=UPI0027D879DF|nr:hypothetical protein [Variovorax paradoxus]
MTVTKELRAQIRAQREPFTDVDGRLVPGSIPFLRGLIEAEKDPLDRDSLLGELSGEYLRADLYDEHLLVQRERVANHPEAAVMWLGLAHSLGMKRDRADEAKQAVAKGLEISRHTGTLIRYSLTCQAAVARQTNDPALFESSLRELIEDAENCREEDSGLDAHILIDLPIGFCPPDLEAKYRNLLEQEDRSS